MQPDQNENLNDINNVPLQSSGQDGQINNGAVNSPSAAMSSSSEAQSPRTVNAPQVQITQPTTAMPQQSPAQPAQSPQVNMPMPEQPSIAANKLGYIEQLKAILINPKSYLDNTADNLKKSIVFIAINLGIMSVVTFITSIIGALKSDFFSGDFLWSLVKNIGFGAFYALSFLFAIAGIVMVISLVAKKDAKFSSVFSVMSVFSLNFITTAINSVISLVLSWINSSDFSNIVFVLVNIIVSIIFVYTCSLIIHGIASMAKFSLLKSTIVYVASTVVLMFVFVKIIDGFPLFFNVSFGQYGGFSGSGGSLSSALDLLKDYLR